MPAPQVSVPEGCAPSAGHLPPERALPRVELGFAAPFDADAVLRHLCAHAIPGAETVQGDTVTRVVPAPSGPVAVTVRLAPTEVSAAVGSSDPADVAAVTAIIRRWFDLDLDPAAVAGVLGPDRLVGPLVRSRPGLRVIGSPAAFETAIMTVLGQQVSLAAARTLGARLVSAFGQRGPAGLTLFPTAEGLAAQTPDAIREAVRLTGARARTLHGLAVAAASGLDLGATTDPVRFRAELLALPGIGPWTADYLAVRVLGDRDAFPATDLVLRRALGGVTPASAEAASEAWRPYRAYALFHLWTATSY